MKGIKHFYITQIYSRMAHFILHRIYIPHTKKKLNDRSLTTDERHELEIWINEMTEAKQIWKEMMLHPDLYKY